MYLAGVILFGDFENLAIAYAVAALVAGITYSAIFLLLGVASRHAVVWGLCYSLIWESVIGNFVSGAKTLSVQQWALALARKIAEPGVVTSAVHLPTAVPLLIVVTIGASVVAVMRLSRLTLAAES
jgi:ABC-2 type transport system permease protein